MLIKIVPSNFFTACRRCMRHVLGLFCLKAGGRSKVFGEQGHQIILSIFIGPESDH